MRNFMIASVLSGVSSILVGCSEGESPSPVVSGKDAAEVKPDVAASVPETASDSPPKDLEEPVLPDEPSPTGELIIGDSAPPISIAKWVKGDPVEGFTKRQSLCRGILGDLVWAVSCQYAAHCVTADRVWRQSHVHRC